MKTKKKNSKGSKKVRKVLVASTQKAGEGNRHKMTRAESVIKALQLLRSGTKDDIIKKSNEIFVESGGKDNPREAGFTGAHVLQGLIAFGSIHLENGVFQIK